jgi:hypothetical protein
MKKLGFAIALVLGMGSTMAMAEVESNVVVTKPADNPKTESLKPKKPTVGF